MKKNLLLLGITLLGISGCASQKSYKETDFLCELNADGTVTITGCKYVPLDLYIPTTVFFEGKEREVTAIGENAFYDLEVVRKVEFAKDSKVSNIEKNAFWKCWNIDYIILPDSLLSIGAGALAVGLDWIVVPSSINIDNLAYAIMGDDKDSITDIELNIFYKGVYSSKYLGGQIYLYSSGEWSFVDGVPTPYSK